MTIPAETKLYRVSFGNEGDPEFTTIEHETREDNDAFALSAQLIGFNICIREFFNPNIEEWYRYHNTRKLD